MSQAPAFTIFLFIENNNIFSLNHFKIGVLELGLCMLHVLLSVLNHQGPCTHNQIVSNVQDAGIDLQITL